MSLGCSAHDIGILYGLAGFLDLGLQLAECVGQRHGILHHPHPLDVGADAVGGARRVAVFVI